MMVRPRHRRGDARTARRPIPAGRIAPGEALGIGITLAAFAVALMTLATNVVAAAVLAVSILFYVFVYTMWLKRRTAQNIVIGGAAGAFPPVIGWAAVTGGVDVMPLLQGYMFFWTPPHFWSLSLCSRRPCGQGCRYCRWSRRPTHTLADPALHRWCWCC